MYTEYNQMREIGSLIRHTQLYLLRVISVYFQPYTQEQFRNHVVF